jgi:hypothetical protein
MALSMTDLICEDCGSDEDVELMLCPFAWDVYGEEKEVALCPDCYKQRCMDI